jgi:serine/threonine-protein kinase RsbW
MLCRTSFRERGFLSEDAGHEASVNGFWPLDRSTYTIRRRVCLPSKRQSISDAVEVIVDVARRCGCGSDQEADLEIALREALANAVIHGNGENEQKDVFVRCYGGSEKTLILVRDDGVGFEPAEIPDPRGTDRVQLDHGRGLFLMRALMDQVVFRRSGSEVLLFKRWS